MIKILKYNKRQRLKIYEQCLENCLINKYGGFICLSLHFDFSKKLGKVLRRQFSINLFPELLLFAPDDSIGYDGWFGKQSDIWKSKEYDLEHKFKYDEKYIDNVFHRVTALMLMIEMIK